MSARWTSNMPFHHNQQQQSNQSSPPYPQENYYATYNAGQNSGTTGEQPNHWAGVKGATGAGGGLNDQTYRTNGDRLIDTSRPGATTTWAPDSQAHYQPPRRTLTIGRADHELHMSQSGSAMSDVHHYGAPPAYGGTDQYSLNVQQNTSQQGQHAGNTLPSTLQPGLSNRPNALQANSSPSAIPTLPQISTQLQQTPGISRSMTQSHSHNYSRSSPGNMDQPRYKPFTNTPETSRYPTSSSNVPQTPSAASPYSPLNLANLRTQAEGGFNTEQPLSPLPSDSQNPYYQMSSSYVAPWPIYAVDWCKLQPRTNDNSAGKVAIGSYLEDNHNFIQILDAHTKTEVQGESSFGFTKTAEATHSYPVTRILWEPPSSNKQTSDLLATSGDHLRLWSLPHDQQSYTSGNTITRKAADAPLQKLSPLALLSNSKSPEHTAPITSLDWNVVSPSLIITSSIDTTCTIWDIPTLTAKTQLIAHDKEVFDVRFCAASVDVFVSCGADGSVRMFDLRSLEHSTIIYEPSDKSQDKSANLSPTSASAQNHSPTRTSPSGSNNNATSSHSAATPPPLLRIAASPHDAHLLATFSSDSNLIRVLDVRQPGQALLELRGHGANVNAIEWSASSRGVLASGGDDCCVLLWDLVGNGGNSTGAGPGGAGSGSGTERGPNAVWECGFEVSNLSWAPGGVNGSGSAGKGLLGGLGVAGGKGFWGVQM